MTTPLSRHFRAERLKRGLTLDQLARLLGYKNVPKGVGKLARFEREGVIAEDLLLKLAEALGLDLAVVEGLRGPDRPPPGVGKKMKDYPQWRMFREARTADATELAWPVVGLVSGFAEGRPVEDAIKAHWRIWHAGRGFYRVVVYGSWGEAEDGYVLFNVEERRRGELEALLARLAGEHHQRGYVLGDRTAATLVTPTGRTALPPFDGRIETLDGWYGNLKPGFIALGVFNRSLVYVAMKLHEHGFV